MFLISLTSPAIISDNDNQCLQLISGLLSMTLSHISFQLADSNFSSTVIQLVCTFSDCFYIFGFTDEFASAVVHLSPVSFGEVSFSFFRLCHFFELFYLTVFVESLFLVNSLRFALISSGWSLQISLEKSLYFSNNF